MRYISKVVLLFLMIISGSGRLIAQWFQVPGTEGWAVNNLAISPNGTGGINIYAVVSSLGLNLSTNKGCSWSEINNGLPISDYMGVVAFGSTVFVLTSVNYHNQLWCSNNNGSNWYYINTDAATTNVWKIAYDGTYLFLASTTGVFRSIDNGVSWINVKGGLSNPVQIFKFIGTNLYFGDYRHGISYSSDYGASWIDFGVPGGMDQSYYNLIAKDNNRFVVASGTDFYHSWNGVYRSIDNGVSWNKVNIDANSFGFIGKNIFVGTDSYGVYFSTNNGDSWSAAGLQNLGGVIIYSSGMNLFAVTQSGVWVRPFIEIIRPTKEDIIIAGIKDSIMWKPGLSSQRLDIKYSTNNGTTWEPDNIATDIPADSGQCYWDVPKEILTRKALIRISNHNLNDTVVMSDTFKIKPWIITKVDANGDYIPYNINVDHWKFFNDPNQMWPYSYYSRFNYQGKDPFTQQSYSQWQGGHVFEFSVTSRFPDWESFVNTFGPNACYWNTSSGIYNVEALTLWNISSEPWDGSCTGIAVSNALAFQKKTEFQNKYNYFPDFDHPIDVGDDDNVRKVINELWTHQLGDPHYTQNFDISRYKSPNQTLNELKYMLKQDTVVIQTLTIESNDAKDPGAHQIIGYKLEQDEQMKNIYHISVYDNNSLLPLSSDEILIDTSAFGGNGRWDYILYKGWGGADGIYLYDAAENYLTQPNLHLLLSRKKLSVFNDNSEIQIYNTYKSNIIIGNEIGQSIGYKNDSLINKIPGAFPYIFSNYSHHPPRGYNLPSNNYSIIMNNFVDTSNRTEMHLLTGNKTYTYRRPGTLQNQTDKLFFNDGLSVSNPDAQTKSVELLNIINETTHEKLFDIRNLSLGQNDSVKVENSNNDELTLINFGTSKNYEIELNYASPNTLGRFLKTDVLLNQNTTHKIIPIWDNLNTAPIKILIDYGNNGTFDDSIVINNVLPVELSVFTASVIGSSVKLTWRTETEINNYGFEVERSAGKTNQTVWTTIGFIKGHGNSNSPNEYSLTDNKVQSGKFYYRLKQLDNNGKYEYSTIVKAEIIAPKNYELRQNYPNPFNSSTIIKYQIPKSGLVTLKVYDILGREAAILVNENKAEGFYEVNFDASKLTSGTYIYQFKVNDFVSTKKMMLLK